MRTARSLTISCSICHARPPAMHTPLPHMPPAMHAPCHICPPATHTSAPCHACPPTTHAPPLCHARPPATHGPHHAQPPATHAPPVDRILDTRFLKYYLAPTSLRAVTNVGILFLCFSVPRGSERTERDRSSPPEVSTDHEPGAGKQSDQRTTAGKQGTIDQGATHKTL